MSIYLFFSGAALCLYLLCQRYDPCRPSSSLLKWGTLGLTMLLTWNLLPLPHLGINPLSALLTGALGVPGLGMIAVLNLMP